MLNVAISILKSQGLGTFVHVQQKVIQLLLLEKKMITIHYQQKDQDLERIEERLKSLSLAYKVEQDPAVKEPTLKDGLETAKGETAIQTYLDQLKGELGQWYYCAC